MCFQNHLLLMCNIVLLRVKTWYVCPTECSVPKNSDTCTITSRLPLCLEMKEIHKSFDLLTLCIYILSKTKKGKNFPYKIKITIRTLNDKHTQFAEQHKTLAGTKENLITSSLYPHWPGRVGYAN